MTLLNGYVKSTFYMEDVLEPNKLAYRLTTALLVLIRSALQATLQKLLFGSQYTNNEPAIRLE